MNDLLPYIYTKCYRNEESEKEKEHIMIMIFQLLVIFTKYQSHVLADCEDIPIDLIIAAANSGKFSNCEIYQQKNFVFNLLEKLDVSKNGTHVRVTSVSSFANFSIPFDTSVSNIKDQFLKRMSGKQDLYDVGNTMKMIAEEGFNASGGGRANAKRVVIIFTNGMSITPSVTDLWADKVKHMPNMSVITIGDGKKKLGLQEMQNIATNKSFAFDVKAFGIMDNILQNVTNLMCGQNRDVANGRCPKSGILYNCSCYILSKSLHGWNTVGAKCQAGYNLAVIDNECEFRFLEENFPTSWIGIIDITNQTIKWEDGSLYEDNFSHYDSGDKYNRHCLHGLSYNHNCRRAMLPSLCERRISGCSAFSCPLNKDRTSTKRGPLTTNHAFMSSYKRNNKTVIQRMKNLKENLFVDKKLLSSQRRKLKSHWDDRKSSTGIGIVGILVIVTGPMLIICSDCMNVVSQKRRTKRGQRRKREPKEKEQQ